MADLEELPDNVIVEILLRVPLESLVRFRCVSKSWYTLIKHPIFADRLSKRNVLVTRIVRNPDTRECDGDIIFSLLKYPLTADDDTAVDVEDVHFPSLGEELSSSSAFIRGHSHGIICFYIRPQNYIFLYNPTTGDLRKLPPSILLFPDGHQDHSYGPHVGSSSNTVGFGYDPKSEDFKVVRVVRFYPYETLYDYEARDPHLPATAEVYDLKKDEWREIESPIPCLSFGCMPPSEMHFRGLYYWLAQHVETLVETIMWFDMSKEVFGQIPLPNFFRRFVSHYCISMGILNESIVLFNYPMVGGFETDKRCFDIWKMVKLGKKVRWSKLIRIGPLSGIQFQYPLGFVGFDQLLMVNGEGQLVIYDISTQQSKYFSLKGNWKEFQAITFVKTSMSINENGNCNGEGIR